jgi:hypothetical protein
VDHDLPIAASVRIHCTAIVIVLALSSRINAQDFTADGPHPDRADVSASGAAPAPDRVFGILPNYSTVERDATVSPISRRWMLEATAKNTFDPYLFPLVGVTTALGGGRSGAFPTRYATAFADNAVGNFMTSALFPSMLNQDPRYYRRGTGGTARRTLYAVSRVGVTRSSAGQSQFNYSEVLGNLTAGAIANVYYSDSARSLTGTLSRWGSQVLWDAVSNELKEFWPDIRHHLRSAPR